MRVRRCVSAVVFALIWVAGPAHPAISATTTTASQCSVEDYNGDARLIRSPAVLPTAGAVGEELIHYDRFAGLTPEQLIAT